MSATPDLLAVLDEIREEAKRAHHRLALGAAVNGSSALKRIEYKAKDALQDAADAGRLDFDAEPVRLP